MGKRKKSSRKPQGPKKNEPLPTVFTCLFCNHERSVTVKLEKKNGVGQLDCKICGQKFQCGINYLSAAVDVYSEWVDAADAVAQNNNNRDRDKLEEPGLGRLSSGRPSTSKNKSDAYEEDDDRGYEGEGVVADDDEYD